MFENPAEEGGQLIAILPAGRAQPKTGAHMVISAVRGGIGRVERHAVFVYQYD
jgi:hypothetical protein